MTLVLLHAFPLDASMWHPQLAAFDGWRVLAPNLSGFGGAEGEEGWSIDFAATFVDEYLAAQTVTEPVVLCGLSMGGYIALSFARQFPEKLKGLILADTRAEADDAKAKEGRAAMIALATEKGSEAVAEMMLPKMLNETTRTTRLLVVEAVRSMIEQQPAASIVAAIEALRDRPDATPGLAAIAVPTLVIVGADDGVTPPALAKTLVDAIPGATLETIPDAGHLSNLEAPQAFNAAVVQFLESMK